MPGRDEVARMLTAAGAGDADRLSQLGPAIYDELRRVAHRQLRRMRPGQTLNTTALVHEAYLKLADGQKGDRQGPAWKDHSHFVSVAAVAMRHLLVDYARQRAALKRGGDQIHVTFGDQDAAARNKGLELLAVDQALEQLTARSARLGRLVELRFFGGLSVEETAAVLSVSERTVKRDWSKARAVLFQLLEEGATPS